MPRRSGWARTALAIASALVATDPRERAQEPTLQQLIASKLDAVVAEAGFPGATVTIVMPDDTVLTAASGWADASHTARLTTAARMPAGSVGKTFVAAEILKEVGDGVLNLDEPIGRWLGQDPWFGRLPNGRDLTLRLLLSHRSGIPESYESKAFVAAIGTHLDKTWTPEDLIAFVLDKKPRFRAGAKYFYTDMNYVVAGLVLERAIGTPLFTRITQRILMPLGLADTIPSERRNLDRVVPGLMEPDAVKAFKSAESIDNGAFVYNTQAEYAGGGLISTPRDLARWAKALYEGRVLKPAQLAAMLDAKPSENGASYGLGVEIVSTGAGPAYGHDGSIFGYQTQMVYFPDLKLAAAMQINSDPMKRFKLSPGNGLGQIISLAVHRLRGR